MNNGIFSPKCYKKLGHNMIRNDLIKRLSLVDQWNDDYIFLVEFVFGHVNTGS